ncbi:hypothetical protein [Wenyingzhuangia sp. 2_MG-2023]|uniref:hypothetical protein n=1 Tax=Wenyingzhuangia sp. 2_MG-2023 TaxID=3062639 RepID=UPI0026E3C903|nr:hypothetical protein [Wenyingzhuangia sp. 2_MG-2023]MDO6737059.1 hypothetical protein [Wenyingzhuangia sp. 2_MG-2023]
MKTVNKNEFIDWYFEDLEKDTLKNLCINLSLGKTNIQQIFNECGYIPSHLIIEEVKNDNKEFTPNEDCILLDLVDKIQQAKDLLKDNGYFVDNLWTIHDVKKIFECSTNQAQEILKESLVNDSITDQVNLNIRLSGENKNLTAIEDMEEEVV